MRVSQTEKSKIAEPTVQEVEDERFNFKNKAPGMKRLLGEKFK